jgi:hypothetical protein
MVSVGFVSLDLLPKLASCLLLSAAVGLDCCWWVQGHRGLHVLVQLLLLDTRCVSRDLFPPHEEGEVRIVFAVTCSYCYRLSTQGLLPCLWQTRAVGIAKGPLVLLLLCLLLPLLGQHQSTGYPPSDLAPALSFGCERG